MFWIFNVRVDLSAICNKTHCSTFALQTNVEVVYNISEALFIELNRVQSDGYVQQMKSREPLSESSLHFPYAEYKLRGTWESQKERLTTTNVIIPITNAATGTWPMMVIVQNCLLRIYRKHLYISFSYWACSDYSFYYKVFSITIMNATSTDTRQVKFNLEFSTNYACSWWSPLKLDKIVLNKPSRPTVNPTSSPPTTVPTITPNMSSLVLIVSGLSFFDGSSQFQYYGPLRRGLSSAFTISVWIKTTTASGVIVNYGRSPSNFQGELILQITSAGKFQFWDDNNVYGFNYVTGNSVVTTGQLIHIAFVKNEINGEFFINGVSDGKVTAFQFSYLLKFSLLYWQELSYRVSPQLNTISISTSISISLTNS
eukprot:gene3475-6918_t